MLVGQHRPGRQCSQFSPDKGSDKGSRLSPNNAGSTTAFGRAPEFRGYGLRTRLDRSARLHIDPRSKVGSICRRSHSCRRDRLGGGGGNLVSIFTAEALSSQEPTVGATGHARPFVRKMPALSALGQPVLDPNVTVGPGTSDDRRRCSPHPDRCTSWSRPGVVNLSADRR